MVHRARKNHSDDALCVAFPEGKAASRESCRVSKTLGAKAERNPAPRQNYDPALKSFRFYSKYNDLSSDYEFVWV